MIPHHHHPPLRLPRPPHLRRRRPGENREPGGRNLLLDPRGGPNSRRLPAGQAGGLRGRIRPRSRGRRARGRRRRG
ncbi:unnamed protein product [Linum tenue]|uniref:Uncharacterized protein n=1 Tax=Linum tenue TaxID=586396 RepID=A0AAV0KA43_9ROSI|nr:unnamed protein product [Linum tenue]